MARAYLQKIHLERMNIPTIDGFQCPTWAQDPEQNSMFKAMLFTPWSCRDALTCGCVSKFAHMLSDDNRSGRGAGAAGKRNFTFQHAWRQRQSVIHILAERAEARGRAARKHLVLADATIFSQIKEPRGSLKVGLRQANALRADFRPLARTSLLMSFDACLTTFPHVGV